MRTTRAKSDDIQRIPVALKDDDDKRIFLAVKQAVEKREGRSISWATLVRLAIRTQATVEGVKCK